MSKEVTIPQMFEKVKIHLNKKDKDAYVYWAKETDDFKKPFRSRDQEMQQIFLMFIAKIEAAYAKADKLTTIEHNYSGYGREGALYKTTRDLGIKEIAKLIRKEVKIMHPDAKVSIKTDYFSGGQSIDLKIIDIGYNPFTKDYTDHLIKTQSTENYPYHEKKKFSKEFLAEQEKIDNIVNQYNFRDYEYNTDYFDNKFYGHVEVDDYAHMEKYIGYVKEIARNKEWNEQYAKRSKEKSEKAKKIREQLPFKKWDLAIWKVRFKGKTEMVDLPVVITKAPNGRGRTQTYSVERLYTKNEIRPELVQTLEERHKATRPNVFTLNGEKYFRAGKTYQSVYPSHLKEPQMENKNSSAAAQAQRIRILGMKGKKGGLSGMQKGIAVLEDGEVGVQLHTIKEKLSKHGLVNIDYYKSGNSVFITFDCKTMSGEMTDNTVKELKKYFTRYEGKNGVEDITLDPRSNGLVIDLDEDYEIGIYDKKGGLSGRLFEFQKEEYQFMFSDDEEYFLGLSRDRAREAFKKIGLLLTQVDVIEQRNALRINFYFDSVKQSDWATLTSLISMGPADLPGVDDYKLLKKAKGISLICDSDYEIVEIINDELWNNLKP